MGNREALLAGARACLSHKAFSQTTARDVASAAGVSLAAIGYHFRSTEALLVEAVFDGLEEWSEHLGRILVAAAAEGAADARAQAVWSGVVDSFSEHRGILAASYELMVRADQTPEVRRRLTDSIEEARQGLAGLLGGVDTHADPGRAHQIGSVYYALLNGLLTQWLVDPEQAPSGSDFAAALKELMARKAP
jgi:AcrR family transcriptional regulator